MIFYKENDMNTDTILLEHEMKLNTVAGAAVVNKNNIDKLHRKIMRLRKGNLLLVGALVATVFMINDLQRQINEVNRTKNEE